MRIEIFKTGEGWDFEVVAPNGTVIAAACRVYAARSKALRAARALAAHKLTVGVRE